MIQTRKKLLFLILSLALFVPFLARPAHSADLTQNLVNVPVSLHFSEIGVSELLQVLAKMGNTNFLLSESITGKITVHLNNTPWQTALHSILASRGLRLIRNGDIYWIGPHAEIQAFQKYRREDAALPFGGDHVNSPPHPLPTLGSSSNRNLRPETNKLTHSALISTASNLNKPQQKHL